MKMKIALGLALVAFVLLAAPRTRADTIFTATLLGSNEAPPTGSPATGFITVTLSGNTLSVTETFSELEAPASAAHIHCCFGPGINAPVAVPFTGFPAATSGSYPMSFDLTLDATYSSAFETAHGGTAASAESALVAALFAGQTYANIHDSIFPGGEISGQLIQQTPEPGTLGSLGLGMVGLALCCWLARKREARGQLSAT